MKYIKIGLALAVIFSTLVAKEITINFQSTPIIDVIKFVATKTKKNILINDAISGNVNFLSNKPIDYITT
jgi:general secretion pathway protein D